MNLAERYETIWKTSIQKLEAGDVEVDPWIDSPEDSRRGLTLLIHPDDDTAASIVKSAESLSRIAPDQYVYPITDLHLTVLTIISCTPGFSLSRVNAEDYVRLITETARSIPAFDIELRGLTVTTSAVMVCGYPNGDSLSHLRDALRESFLRSGLEHSIDRRYRIETAHITVLRFRKPLAEPASFVKALQQLRETAFGRFEVSELELTFNDWYQRQANSDRIARIPLGN